MRESGKKVESKVNDAKSDFSKAQTQEALSKKIDNLLEGLSALGDALIAQRVMLGNITGVALSAALLAERSNKEITKLMKGKRR